MLRTCPKCYVHWMCKEASITKSRMERARVTFKSRLHHVILSFDKGDINDKDSINEFRKDCYKFLKLQGIDGGGMVIHPWREDHDGNFRVHGLHVHAFVIGKWLQPADGASNIIFKRIGELRYYKQYKYVFEHCGVTDKIHAITWFGCMSYRNFPKVENEKHGYGSGREVTCPNCQCAMELLVIIDWTARDIVLVDYG